MERRLAAILAADVVGYSRLIREDEAGTLAALKAHREQLIEPKVAERKGRIVKLMGDGMLVITVPCTGWRGRVRRASPANSVDGTARRRARDGPGSGS